MSKHKSLEELGITRLDFRKVARQAPVETHIKLGFDGMNVLWISTSYFELREHMGWTILSSKVGHRATDEEHRSAYLFEIPLIGFSFIRMYSSVMCFEGVIAPPQDEHILSYFRVPKEPIDLAEADKCQDCSGNLASEHPIVDYLPPFDAELYNKLAGRPVVINYVPKQKVASA